MGHVRTKTPTGQEADRRPSPAQRLPLGLKLAYTGFVAVLVPVYWHYRGPAEFLWLSDVALFLGVAALWRESRLLASMMGVGALAPELVWSVSFLGRLATGQPLFALTNYMFDPAVPLPLRTLSLFHLFLPPLILWLLARWGYDRRALAAQTALTWLVVPLSRLLTAPTSNVNWVYGWPGAPPAPWPAPLYVGGLMLALALLVYWPTHLLLGRLFARPPAITPLDSGASP